jgi:hypothetical protein
MSTTGISVGGPAVTNQHKHCIFLLAMSRLSKSDLARCRILEDCDWRTITVSHGSAAHLKGTRGEHLDCSFKTPWRAGKMYGFQALVARVQQLSREHSWITVVIDYFFLQSNYFSGSYGTDWLSDKVSRLFHAGASSCILPRSNCVIAMEKQPQAMQGIHISFEENPLWVATKKAFEEGVIRGKGSHEDQMRWLVDHKAPFLLLSREHMNLDPGVSLAAFHAPATRAALATPTAPGAGAGDEGGDGAGKKRNPPTNGPNMAVGVQRCKKPKLYNRDHERKGDEVDTATSDSVDNRHRTTAGVSLVTIYAPAAPATPTGPAPADNRHRATTVGGAITNMGERARAQIGPAAGMSLPQQAGDDSDCAIILAHRFAVDALPALQCTMIEARLRLAAALITKNPALMDGSTPIPQNVRDNVKALWSPRKADNLMVTDSEGNVLRHQLRDKLLELSTRSVWMLQPPQDGKHNGFGEDGAIMWLFALLSGESPRTFFADSYFLLNLPEDPAPNQLPHELSYKKAMSFFKHFNLTDYDAVAIPVNSASHWYGFKVLHQGSRDADKWEFELFDGLPKDDDFFSEDAVSSSRKTLVMRIKRFFKYFLKQHTHSAAPAELPLSSSAPGQPAQEISAYELLANNAIDPKPAANPYDAFTCPMQPSVGAPAAYRAPFNIPSSTGHPAGAVPSYGKSRQKCELCPTNIVTLPPSRQVRELAALFAQLLQWAPKSLPVICVKCWKEKHPALHAEMASCTTLRNNIGEANKGFYCVAHIPTDVGNARLHEELRRRRFENLDWPSLQFQRNKPHGWWRTTSFCHVAPLCVSFKRFESFARAILRLSPTLSSITERSKSLKKSAAAEWNAPDGTSLKKSTFTKKDWQHAAKQFGQLTCETDASRALSIDRCVYQFPLVTRGEQSHSVGQSIRSSRHAPARFSTVRKIKDTTKPCYFSISHAQQRLFSEKGADRFTVLHREVLLSSWKPQDSVSLVLDCAVGSVGADAKISAMSVGIKSSTRRSRLPPKQPAGFPSGLLTSPSTMPPPAKVRPGREACADTQPPPAVPPPPSGSKPRCGRARKRRSKSLDQYNFSARVLELKSQVTSLLSFNLWGGGVMPLSELHSAACYASTIGGLDSALLPSLPSHPTDCLCARREYVLVGGFHIVHSRQPYVTHAAPGSAEVLVAGFHAVHSIGPQLTISSPMSQPVSVYNVQLAVQFAQTLQQAGVSSFSTNGPSSAIDTLNLPLMLFFLRASGLPVGVLGPEVQRILCMREKDLQDWTKRQCRRLATDIVCNYTTTRSRGTYITMICDICQQRAYLGYIRTAAQLICFRCDLRESYVLCPAMIIQPPVSVFSLFSTQSPDVSSMVKLSIGFERFVKDGAFVINQAAPQTTNPASIEAIVDPFAKLLLSSKFIIVKELSRREERCVRQTLGPTLEHEPFAGGTAIINQVPCLVALLNTSASQAEFWIRPGSHTEYSRLASEYRACLDPKQRKIKLAAKHDWARSLCPIKLRPGNLVLWDSRCVVQLPNCSYVCARFSPWDTELRSHGRLVSWKPPTTITPYIPNPLAYTAAGALTSPVQIAGLFEEPAPSVHILTGPWHRATSRMERLFAGGLSYIVPFFKQSAGIQMSSNTNMPATQKLPTDELYDFYQNKLNAEMKFIDECKQIPEERGGREAWEERTVQEIRNIYEDKLQQLLQHKPTTPAIPPLTKPISLSMHTASPTSASSPMRPSVVRQSNTSKPPNHKVSSVAHLCVLSSVPLNFKPCCVSNSEHFCATILLMAESFRENLTGSAPPKTQTLRVWTEVYAASHWRAFQAGTWVRVWRGQGHKFTVGWAKYTAMRRVRLGNLDRNGCCREGRPLMTPSDVLKMFLLRGSIPAKPARFSASGRYYKATPSRPAVTCDTNAWEVRFVFRPCK